MFFHPDLPTIFATIIVSCLALALTLGWASRGSPDGLATWALGLCMQAVVFALLALRGSLPDPVLAALGNFLLAVALSLFLVAIHRFQKLPQNYAGVLLPPAVLVLGLLVAARELHERIAFANLIYLVQIALICLRLLRFRYDFPTHGRNLILLGMALNLTGAASRIWIAAFRPENLHGFLEPSPSQAMGFLSVFAAVILASNGFVMMAKERSDARLRDFARRDSLTGCWNRIRVEEVAERELARLRRYGHPVSAILVDLDHFKEVNDRHGHALGDVVLKDFAQIARAATRETDVVGRWGGEEFVVVLPMCGLAEAVATAERLRARVREHGFAAGVRMTVSVGVAAGLSSETWDAWMKRADLALYRAKTNGRDNVQVDGVAFTQGPAPGGPPTARMIWCKDFASGDLALDAQHRALFDEVNALLALGDAPQEKAKIVAAVRAFLAAEIAHFAEEERIVAAAAYDGAAEHACLHRDLLARAETLLDRYVKDEIAACGVLDFIVHELFAHHLLTEDTRFHRALGV
jgi:diguanylate cyclase (GGDEF)-like protein/hemerythrin-like metal-binding protein